MNGSIIQDVASGAFYCGRIKGVPQWREDESQARRMSFDRVNRVVRELLARDARDGVPVLDLRVFLR